MNVHLPFETTTQVEVLKESFHTRIVKTLGEFQYWGRIKLSCKNIRVKNFFRRLNDKVNSGSHVLVKIHAKALAKPVQHFSQQISTLLEIYWAILDIVGCGGGPPNQHNISTQYLDIRNCNINELKLSKAIVKNDESSVLRC